MNRTKSICPVSVLGLWDKANNSVSPAVAAPSKAPPPATTCKQGVNNTAVINIRKQCDALLTGCPPVILNRVHEYLSMKEGPDALLVEAWARYGRADRQRTVDLQMNDIARRTVSPLGLACLVAYARAWLDEAEAIQQEQRAQVARSFGKSGNAATPQTQETTPRPLARVAVASKRRTRKK